MVPGSCHMARQDRGLGCELPSDFTLESRGVLSHPLCQGVFVVKQGLRYPRVSQEYHAGLWDITALMLMVIYARIHDRS